MKRSDFVIGLEFWSGEKRWRCTDVGTRVVVAICLEPHEVVTVALDRDGRRSTVPRSEMTDDPSWFNGPPYAVVEHVFDEDSQLSCTVNQGLM